MKLALPVEKVVRAAAEGVGDLCQFLLPRCIIYKWRLAPAGSLAARIKYWPRAPFVVAGKRGTSVAYVIVGVPTGNVLCGGGDCSSAGSTEFKLAEQSR